MNTDQEQNTAGTPAEGAPQTETPAVEPQVTEDAPQDPTLPESVNSDVPAEDACSDCLGTGLLGDPAMPGNKVCDTCRGTGRK